MAQLNVTATDLAHGLLVGPMCAVTLVDHLRWFAGWDVSELSAPSTRMMHAWRRIAGVPLAR